MKTFGFSVVATLDVDVDAFCCVCVRVTLFGIVQFFPIQLNLLCFFKYVDRFCSFKSERKFREETGRKASKGYRSDDKVLHMSTQNVRRFFKCTALIGRVRSDTIGCVCALRIFFMFRFFFLQILLSKVNRFRSYLGAREP